MIFFLVTHDDGLISPSYNIYSGIFYYDIGFRVSRITMNITPYNCYKFPVSFDLPYLCIIFPVFVVNLVIIEYVVM